MLRRATHRAHTRRSSGAYRPVTTMRSAAYPRVMDASTPFPRALTDAILAWYAEQWRRLAFRRTSDPYAILVSEAMAQQTQAARAAEAWERFMARFPTVQALASASLADVLREWQGLGYDRRARNLWRAAQLIVETHGGQIPHDLVALEALPGVGPYTARAVAALAFGVPVGAVDTNVRRVLGRIVAGDASALDARATQALADSVVPADRPGVWTHALMDLGATVCRAARTECDACPAQPWCRYAADAWAVGRPVTALPTRAVRRPSRGPAIPFPATNRWLRGRILDRLRASPGDDWVRLTGPLGVHDDAAIERALAALDRDGLVERDAHAGVRLRMG
jgi:A/G-specific adenine glycosylase